MALGNMVKGIVSGGLGNYNEVSPEQLQEEYGKYLTSGETIKIGFKLVRDALIFTNYRIIFFDKQGATGVKMSVESINLDSIYEVKMETSGVGFDDSELTFSYITSPYFKANNITVASHKLEFPKKYDVQKLYRILQGLAHKNHELLNQ